MKYDAGGADGGGVSSLPVRGAWIEISSPINLSSRSLSLPVRGAWIEMCRAHDWKSCVGVAPRAGSVD